MALGTTAQRVYDDLRQSVDDPNGDLATYVGALGDELLQDIENLVRDGDNGETGWSKILDLSRADDVGLDYLAQFIGVYFTGVVPAATKRTLIAARTGWQRGTPGAMIAAAQTTLTGTKAVTFIERNGDPYFLTVVTKASETPDPASTFAALLSQKPAGIVLFYQNITGQTYFDLFTTNAASYAIAFSQYSNYQNLLLNNSVISGTRTFGSGTMGSGTFGG